MRELFAGMATAALITIGTVHVVSLNTANPDPCPTYGATIGWNHPPVTC